VVQLHGRYDAGDTAGRPSSASVSASAGA
jgi:hypothetical protein